MNDKKKTRKAILTLILFTIIISIITFITYKAFTSITNKIIPIADVKPTSTFASPLNKDLFDYERNEVNDTNSMNNAILSRGGSALNTCVLFQASSLDSLGIEIPSNITFTTNFAQYLEDNGWVKETNFNNLQSGDICFAGNTHTFLFMGWENQSKDLAYVMGDESYMFPKSYSIRNLNGQYGTAANGNNAQYQTTFYLKYVGTSTGKNISALNTKNNELLKSSLGKVAVNSTSGLWMTSEMNLSSTKLVCLDDNIILYVLKSQNGWYEVYYDGYSGWVESQYTTGLGNPIANENQNIEYIDANSSTQTS